MKVIKAIFEFRGWRFIFERSNNKQLMHGRVYPLWNIEAWHYNEKESVYKGDYYAFVPSACICKRIIKCHFKNNMSTKRKKQLLKNFKQ